MSLSDLKAWCAKHPQRLLAFLQVTISQVALWSFLPPKVCAAMSGIAGLFQVWSAFFVSTKEKEKEDESTSNSSGV